jgi:spore coat polysaccharide biosynthesis protein SpsF
MTTAVVIQARNRSGRLPGKVLERVGDMTILGHVIERCRAIRNADIVCCATTEEAIDDPIIDEAKSFGVDCYRGSETDVLSRYYEAAIHCDADIVVRVTCDCPLIDPGVCERIISAREKTGADFAANNFIAEWPHGLDSEVFTFDALSEANKQAIEKDDRGEFVTPWMRRNSGLRRVHLCGPGGCIAENRWTLDYPEDLDFLMALEKAINEPLETVRWEALGRILKENPSINDINLAQRIPGRPSHCDPAILIES